MPTRGRAGTAADPAAYLSELFVSWQGEGARVGQKHLFVRFAGCNLRCAYCDTPYSLTKVPQCTVHRPDGSRETLDNPFTVTRLAALVGELCAADPAIAMVAITGGEPLVQHEFLAAWLEQAPPPVGCLLETNAMLTDGLARILPRIEVVSADVKLPSNSGERPLWERHREFLAACSDTDLYVKMPVDAGTAPEEVREGARLVGETAPGATLFVQPLTQPDSAQWRIGEDRLAFLAGIAAAEVNDTRVLPQLHKLLGIR